MFRQFDVRCQIQIHRKSVFSPRLAKIQNLIGTNVFFMNINTHMGKNDYLCSRKYIEVMKRPAIIVPEGIKDVLLHACCAPCSSAIVEWLVQHDIRPTIFYYNPNIWPLEEYEIRKNESKRHAEALGLTWIDGDYNHEQWREGVCGLEHEPERGRRCEQCFTLRLIEASFWSRSCSS